MQLTLSRNASDLNDLPASLRLLAAAGGATVTLSPAQAIELARRLDQVKVFAATRDALAAKIAASDVMAAEAQKLLKRATLAVIAAFVCGFLMGFLPMVGV